MHDVSSGNTNRGLSHERQQPNNASAANNKEKVAPDAPPKSPKVVPDAPKTPKQEYRRHVIELHTDFDDVLEKLRLRLRLRSKTDVMQKAVQLLAVVVGDSDGEKRQIYLSINGKTQELVLV